MYINGIIVGIFSTLFVEMAIVILGAVVIIKFLKK